MNQINECDIDLGEIENLTKQGVVTKNIRSIRYDLWQVQKNATHKTMRGSNGLKMRKAYHISKKNYIKHMVRLVKEIGVNRKLTSTIRVLR